MCEQEKTFGDRLRELRKERKLRQDDVADDLNVSRQTISKYERDEREPDYLMLLKIADYYQVSLDFLFGRTPVRPVSKFHEWEYLFGLDLPRVADEAPDKTPK
jgi:transcriptional regulator with XRE-family HTH domain